MINLYLRTLTWRFFGMNVKDSTASSVGLLINTTIFFKVLFLLPLSHFNIQYNTYIHRDCNGITPQRALGLYAMVFISNCLTKNINTNSANEINTYHKWLP
jgi:hypothetical protein